MGTHSDLQGWYEGYFFPEGYFKQDIWDPADAERSFFGASRIWIKAESSEGKVAINPLMGVLQPGKR